MGVVGGKVVLQLVDFDGVRGQQTTFVHKLSSLWEMNQQKILLIIQIKIPRSKI